MSLPEVDIFYYVQFLIVPAYLFFFQLFPTNWRAWLLAAIITLPFYGFFALFLWNFTLNDGRHGEGFIFFTYMVFPAVFGSLTRAVGLTMQSKGWSRLKATTIDMIGVVTLVLTVIFGSNYFFKPYKIPNLPPLQNSQPLEKIE